MLEVHAFYDALAPWYHLVYQDWEASTRQQGRALSSLMAGEWGSPTRRVLDAAVGIGTQALGLAALDFQVTGSDISLAAIQRAGEEAGRRGLHLSCLVGDVRALPVRSATFDAVLACDNALPHLLTENEIQCAFTECFRCIRPRGGCVISMRDYGAPPSPGTIETQDYGDRIWSARQCRLRQTRRWRGQFYDVTFELVTNDGAKEVVLRTPETTYFAIGVERMAVLMEEAGFTRVRRIDGCLFQPVLVGTR
jgi:ubiquinone/menaquinone biosynthesis C-methylase UbiE